MYESMPDRNGHLVSITRGNLGHVPPYDFMSFLASFRVVDPQRQPSQIPLLCWVGSSLRYLALSVHCAIALVELHLIDHAAAEITSNEYFLAFNCLPAAPRHCFGCLPLVGLGMVRLRPDPCTSPFLSSCPPDSSPPVDRLVVSLLRCNGSWLPGRVRDWSCRTSRHLRLLL